MKAIGIDIGTTTISGVVVEVDERRHSTVIEAKTIQNGSFIELLMSGNESRMQKRLSKRQR